MNVRQFLGVRKKKSNIVRMGIEFATEATRKKMGKPIKDADIIRVLHKARELNQDIHLFFIGGLNTWQEWYDFFDIFPDEAKFRPRVFLKFTNLDINQMTPLYKERRRLPNPDNLLDKTFVDKLKRTLISKNQRVRIYQVKYPAYSYWRWGTRLCETEEQFKRMWAMRNSQDVAKMRQVIEELKLLNTDYLADGTVILNERLMRGLGYKK